MRKCRYCPALIEWGRNQRDDGELSDSFMPLDEVGSPGPPGTIVELERAGGIVIVKVLRDADLLAYLTAHPEARMRRHHRATCPGARREPEAA